MQYRYVEQPPDWEEHERPAMPGSPARLQHTLARRLAYVAVGLFVGLVGGLGNGLVTANLTAIQGQLGLTQVEAAWLPAAYVMVNVTANLLVFKSRQQLGLRVFAEWGLGIYAVLALAHVFVEGYTMSLVVRGVSGFAGATTTSLAVMYVMQGLPVARIPAALILAMNMSSVAVPLAWVLSPALATINPWPHLYAFEAGLALLAFAAVVLLKLPKGMQIHVFEPLDLLTFALVAPAVALLCAVLAQGVNAWWLNAPWLAYALIASIVLFTLAGILEYSRRTPLIQLRWLLHPSTLMFMAGALLMRFMISEQNYGVVGLLRAMGLTPDQLQPLYGVILAGMLVGVVAGALTFSADTILPQILVSILLICIGGYLDLHSTSQSRPHDFFFSQFLVSCAAALFMGPLMMIGFKHAMSQGADHMITFIVLFSVTQSVGGLMGAALLGTIQQARAQVYTQAIAREMPATDAQVNQRLAQTQASYSKLITDPVQRNAQSRAQLAQTVRREAAVLAFNDVFRVIGTMALSFLGWALYRALRLRFLAWLGRRRAARAAAEASF
ncbi:MFS transporter [Comamonas odontotermitis]|uniref:MFS transporter n=1 Tax=Comamonas odontotermitis TaxID=379895 RepID=UPI0037504CB5